MSISDRHSVNPFVSGKSEPLGGQRLAKVGYKTTKATPAKFPSVCASVPVIESNAWTDDQFKRLQPHLIKILSDAQDGIFRSLYESSHGALSAISDDDISVESCINYLDAESTGGRLTIELLNAWFDENVRTNLTVVIAEKLGFDLSTPEQESTVDKHINGYRGMIASLSGGKTTYQPNQCDAILRALTVSSVDDEISVKLIAKLNQMKNPVKVEELLEL